MPDSRIFIDTNVLCYLLSENTEKADRAERIVEKGGLISVQVLNELANVALKKLAMTWEEINEVLDLLKALCPVESLTLETHDMGRRVAQRYMLSVYDSMIVASALLAGCEILYSEDMQNGLLVDGQLCIHNPFDPGCPLTGHSL